MKNLYLSQMARKNSGNWSEFHAHQYDAYRADEGDIVDMPYGEIAVLIEHQHGVIYLDGEFTDEEREDGYDIEPAEKYIFYLGRGVYNTQVYTGEMYFYDYPTINEYHDKPFDIDPNDYKLNGYYESAEAEPDMGTIEKQVKYFNTYLNK